MFTDTKDVCRTFSVAYISTESLINAIVVFSTLLNMFLKKSLKSLTQSEYHSSVDKEQGSLLLKLFVAVYINMAFTALVVFGSANGLPKFFSEYRIFQGYVRTHVHTYVFVRRV